MKKDFNVGDLVEVRHAASFVGISKGDIGMIETVNGNKIIFSVRKGSEIVRGETRVPELSFIKK